MDYNEKVEFTPEGFKKAVDSLDFLPKEAAAQLSSVFMIISKMI